MSHCPVTAEGKRKRKKEGPGRVVGTSLMPWSGLEHFSMLAKGLPGKEGPQLSEEQRSAVRAGRDLGRSSRPGKGPWRAYLPGCPIQVCYLASLFPPLVLDHASRRCSLWAFAIVLASPPVLAGQIVTCLLVLSLASTSLGKPFLHPSLSIPCRVTKFPVL